MNLARCHANLLLRARFGRECLILIAEIAYNQFGATGCIEREIARSIGDGTNAAPFDHDVSAWQWLAVLVNDCAGYSM